MSDPNTVRDVVSDIEDRWISLEERDRLCYSEELIHLCGAYQSLDHAAHSSDWSEVWEQLREVEQLIEERLDAISWEDAEWEREPLEEESR